MDQPNAGCEVSRHNPIGENEELPEQHSDKGHVNRVPAERENARCDELVGPVEIYFVWQTQGPYQMTLYGSKGVAHFMITDDPKIYHFPDPEWTPGKPGLDWRLITAPKDVQTGAEANVHLLIADLFRAIETDTQTVAGFSEDDEAQRSWPEARQRSARAAWRMHYAARAPNLRP
jgi:hypothetical protein